MRKRELVATLKSRISDIDVEVHKLRCEQRGLEQALSIVEGHSSTVTVVKK